MASPEQMRQATAGYVRTLHLAYLAQAASQPPAVRGRMPLLGKTFSVVAAGARNLHVIATTESLPPPRGPEEQVDDHAEDVRWTLRFLDPSVLPVLGMIDESAAPAPAKVRRALGITTWLYHLVVEPGSQLTAHHAGHAGSGLASSHVAEARDFESIRAAAAGREELVDEMEGAATAGLVRAQALLAREVAPWDDEVRALADQPRPDPAALRRALLRSVRGAVRA